MNESFFFCSDIFHTFWDFDLTIPEF